MLFSIVIFLRVSRFCMINLWGGLNERRFPGRNRGKNMSLMLIYCWSNMLLISRSFMESSVIEHGRYTCLAGLHQGNTRKMTDGWLSGPVFTARPNHLRQLEWNAFYQNICHVGSLVKAPKNDHLTNNDWKKQMPCMFVPKPACHVMPASLSWLQSQKKCQRRQESFQQYLHTFMHSFCHSHQCMTSHWR